MTLMLNKSEQELSCLCLSQEAFQLSEVPKFRIQDGVLHIYNWFVLVLLQMDRDVAADGSNSDITVSSQCSCSLAIFAKW